MANKYNTELTFKLLANAEAFRSELQKAQGSFKSFTGFVKGAAGAIGIGLGINEIISFGQEVITVRGEFQKLEKVLENTLGSNSTAQRALSQINKYAQDNAQLVQEQTAAYVKLVNQGFTPTIAQIENLNDVANSTSKNIDQLAEAIIDAQTGEFERLKEFGIRASKEGDRVTFTFKGVQQEVAFTAKAIQDYIVGLGDLQGVSGSTAAISETLSGQIKALAGNLTELRNQLGQTVEKEGAGFLGWLNEALTKINQSLAKKNDPFGGLVVNSEDLAEMEAALANIQKRRADLEKAVAAGRGITDIGGIDPVKELEKVNKALTEQIRLLNEVAQTQASKADAVTAPVPYLKQLEDQLKEATAARDALTTTDPAAFAVFNRQIEDLTAKIKELKSVTVTSKPFDTIQSLFRGKPEGNIPTDLGNPVPLRDGNALKAFAEQQMKMIEGFRYITEESLMMTQMVASNFATMAGSISDSMVDIFFSFDGFDNLGKKLVQSFARFVSDMIKQAIKLFVIKKIITGLFGAALGPVGLGVGGVLSAGMAVPALASGTNYVKRDGLAMLHKGEEVRPASVVGGGYKVGGGGGTTVNINPRMIRMGRDLFMAFEDYQEYEKRKFGG